MIPGKSNLAASVRDRLQNAASDTGRPFAEVLQYFGLERFLYRFSRSEYADRFVLKGALLFTVWQIPERRTTLDLDFLAFMDNQVESMIRVVRDICRVPVEPDGLVFDPNTVQGRSIKEDADYEGVRVKFTGFLERSRIPMQMDIGFGDIVYPANTGADYPVILDFPKPRLNVYPAESVISEKFEAMVNLGPVNSRMKDFYDIRLLKRSREFHGPTLSEAIRKTFHQRHTDIPAGSRLFSEEFYDPASDRQSYWKAFLKKGDIRNVPETLADITLEIEQFLSGPVNAVSNGQSFTKQWNPDGRWS